MNRPSRRLDGLEGLSRVVFLLGPQAAGWIFGRGHGDGCLFKGRGPRAGRAAKMQMENELEVLSIFSNLNIHRCLVWEHKVDRFGHNRAARDRLRPSNSVKK